MILYNGEPIENLTPAELSEAQKEDAEWRRNYNATIDKLNTLLTTEKFAHANPIFSLDQPQDLV